MNSALPPSRMSVPRPAMLVAIVTVALRPAWATISASCAWYLALRTTCLMPRSLSSLDSRSDFSIETVPTRTGRPSSCLLDDVGDDRLVLLFLGAVDRVRFFDPLQRPVGRDDHDVELVDLGELFRLGVGGAGHAGELAVLAEVVLEGDGRERLVLALDLDLLLGLDRLVQAVAPAPARHQAAGELVDDDDLAVLDHVLDVEVEQRVRPQRLVDVVEQRHVDRIVEAAESGCSRCASIFSALAMPLSVSVTVLCFSSLRKSPVCSSASRSSALTLPWVTAPGVSFGMIRSTS